MLMLLSLFMALVGAESGAEGEEEVCRGGARQDSLSQLASKVKGRGGGCSGLSYRWVEGGGASGVLIPGTTVERDGKDVNTEPEPQ